jgi:hypothetical protein
MNSRNGHKVHEGGKILACAESVVTCMDVVRGSSASGLIFLLPRILAGSNESNYRKRDAQLFRRGQHLSVIRL